jgi:hypothetical protein
LFDIYGSHAFSRIMSLRLPLGALEAVAQDIFAPTWTRSGAAFADAVDAGLVCIASRTTVTGQTTITQCSRATTPADAIDQTLPST